MLKKIRKCPLGLQRGNDEDDQARNDGDWNRCIATGLFRRTGSDGLGRPAGVRAVLSGAAGLVAAITAANVAGGTINLAPGCTYTLTAPATTTPIPMIGGVAGLPAITNQVTINGFNTTIARSSTSPAPFRIFEVDAPNRNLTLQGLTITGGNSTNGGAIANPARPPSITPM